MPQIGVAAKTLLELIEPMLWMIFVYGRLGNAPDVEPGETSSTCVLDRVLHHSITINIKGESYRLQEKLKAGIVQRKEPKE